MGIYTSQNDLLNSKNLLFLVFPTIELFAMFVFILYKADSANEYNSAFYIFYTNLGISMYYWISVWRMPNIVQLIEQFEEFIERSTQKKNYFIFQALKIIAFRF